jgi:2-desacetyl-2-hydroxyethyl bacteriochlorophyllide A dehydrogenase
MDGRGEVKAFVVTAPGECSVQDVEAPSPKPGEVVVDVARVGVCGTDVEFFTGEMAYLHDGHSAYPMRLGHEWCGVVVRAGSGVDESWIGRRVVGDTMLGCGGCYRCQSGRQHLCEQRTEVGISGGTAGALAEQLAVPVSSLHELPDAVDDPAGAMVEPGGNALRAVWAAGLRPDDRLLVLGPGTIGLLVAQFAHAAGAEVHILGKADNSLSFARSLGIGGVWTASELPSLAFDAVIDASNAADLPALALDLVEPGKRVVYIGLAGVPSTIDTRTMALKDVTAVGILSGSPGLSGAIGAYASGSVDPRPLVAATVGLKHVGDVLAGWRPGDPDTSAGPKIHVDPHR